MLLKAVLESQSVLQISIGKPNLQNIYVKDFQVIVQNSKGLMI